ncbi:amino-acid N-acetyltransferase [Georgenia sp. EYE_87]|uniref:amino-acid N-acetyltransferase n=1 Tax=Georgenia sp. EYE_87 TaxID=2853448 RepID=UPI0020032B94|nr:amino-acid N-acetyltransferase [Georgenia sp. EYE_87]
MSETVVVRQARPADVRAIYDLVQPYAENRILIAKELIDYFEAVQEFVVAELADDAASAGDQAGGLGSTGAGSQATSRASASAGDRAADLPIVGCGALHVLWDDIAEVRTLAVAPEMSGRGIGHRLLNTLVGRARDLGLRRVFCLTFEVDFFRRHGFEVIAGTPVGMDVYAQMLRSHDDGVAEFLDLARVKPNTLGNSRMLLEL